MRKLTAAVLVGSLWFAAGASLRAHDGGHGPKLTDEGKQGGVVSSVINTKDLKKGAKAEVIYKAELVRSEDGMVSVYLYDIKMNTLDMSKFERKAKGDVEVQVKKKHTTTPFELNLADGRFVGAAPKASRKPFNIDVYFKQGDRQLLAAFDNLD